MRPLMIIQHIAVITLVTLGLVACGGGSDSKETAVTSTSDDNKVAPVSSESGMQDLAVESDFDFTTDVTVTVDVIANLVDQRAYLNVCKAEAVVISDDTCFFRSPVTAAGLNRKIVIPHKKQALEASIWFYDVKAEPLKYAWSYDQDATVQAFVLGKSVTD